MKTRLAAVAVVCACGRVGFDPRAGDGGDGGDGGATPDAAGPCVQWSTFSAPTHVVELGAPATDDWGPALSADGLSIYFYSGRNGGLGSFDIWTATRPAIGAMWTTPVEVPNVNAVGEERVPWISSDGLTLGFASDRGGNLDFYWATRPNTSAAFGVPVPIPNVNSGSTELASNLSANGLRLYISSTRGGGPGGLDLFVAERPTTADAFGTPVLIPELCSSSNERDIAVSADELEVFIVTNRGTQGDDVYRATRPDITSAWSAPVRVDELDTAMDDTGPDISRDGTTLFYNYDAVSAGGDAEIWYSTRTCLR